MLISLEDKDQLAGAAAYTRSIRLDGVGRGGKARTETLEIRSLNNARGNAAARARPPTWVQAPGGDACGIGDRYAHEKNRVSFAGAVFLIGLEEGMAENDPWRTFVSKPSTVSLRSFSEIVTYRSSLPQISRAAMWPQARWAAACAKPAPRPLGAPFVES
jgi:hypothetical protein